MRPSRFLSHDGQKRNGTSMHSASSTTLTRSNRWRHTPEHEISELETMPEYLDRHVDETGRGGCRRGVGGDWAEMIGDGVAGASGLHD